MIDVVNINEKLARFSDHWNPRIAGRVNDTHIKLVKFKGEFTWHQHENEDEMFLVVSGSFVMKLRDKDLVLHEGEFVIIPKGTEHKPVAANEVQVMLIEPVSTVNTGNVTDERTRTDLETV